MNADITALFERYERFFRRSLAGTVDVGEAAALYAPEFIAASPAGVRTGRNDGTFVDALSQGYDHYRAIGTKDMRIRDVRVVPIDDHHCVAHVAWTATYARKGSRDVAIDFDVSYLIQTLNDDPKIFGWVSGDEQALLKKHGIG